VPNHTTKPRHRQQAEAQRPQGALLAERKDTARPRSGAVARRCRHGQEGSAKPRNVKDPSIVCAAILKPEPPASSTIVRRGAHVQSASAAGVVFANARRGCCWRAYEPPSEAQPKPQQAQERPRVLSRQRCIYRTSTDERVSDQQTWPGRYFSLAKFLFAT